MHELLKDRTVLDGLFATGWQMVEGRDAIEKTYSFKSFVVGLWLDDSRGDLGREI